MTQPGVQVKIAKEPATRLNLGVSPVKITLIVLACLVSLLAQADNLNQLKVVSRKISEGKYELSATVANTTDVSEAQKLLMPEARRICKGAGVQLGHYDFNAEEALQGPPKLPHLILNQEVFCGGQAAAKSGIAASYEWTPSSKDDQLLAQKTSEYLSLKDRGELKAAYGQFSDTMKETSRFDSWVKTMRTLDRKAGKVKFRKIKAVSWYKDPPGVQPGFYAAVDYSGQFDNVDLECGYVGWYRDVKGQLAISNEFESSIDNETKQKMSAAELKDAIGKLGCVPS